MRNIFLVMSREFLTQARKKSFIIITILAPVLIILVNIAIIYITQANETNTNIAVVDITGQFSSDFKSTPKHIYNFYPEKNFPVLKDSLLKGKSLDAVLYIPGNQDSLMKGIEEQIHLYTNKKLSKNILVSIEKSLGKNIEKHRRLYFGVKESDLEQIKSKISLQITNIKDGEKDNISEIKGIMAMVLMYVVMMFIIIYGTRVMRSIMEEKNNRVVEIIISSVKPFELMMGKILGTTLVALTQFCIWIMMTMLFLFAGHALLGQEVMVSTGQENMHHFMNYDTQMETKHIVDSLLSLNYPLIIFIFLFSFIAGYLFYSSFFAAIGAAVDNDTESQQFMPMIVVPLFIGAYGSFAVMNNPEGPIAFWFSMIPFTSPLVLIVRSFYGIPIWQLLLSIIIMVVSVIAMVYIAGKIYRVGILMYGKKVSFKELWKWVRQA